MERGGLCAPGAAAGLLATALPRWGGRCAAACSTRAGLVANRDTRAGWAHGDRTSGLHPNVRLQTRHMRFLFSIPNGIRNDDLLWSLQGRCRGCGVMTTREARAHDPTKGAARAGQRRRISISTAPNLLKTRRNRSPVVLFLWSVAVTPCPAGDHADPTTRRGAACPRFRTTAAVGAGLPTGPCGRPTMQHRSKINPIDSFQHNGACWAGSEPITGRHYPLCLPRGTTFSTGQPGAARRK